MRINNQYYHTIWLNQDQTKVCIIDQRTLPFELTIEELSTAEDVYWAIRNMHVRGAPLIGIAAAYGMYLASLTIPAEGSMASHMEQAAELLRSSRPTAVNLSYAINKQIEHLYTVHTQQELKEMMLRSANQLKDQEIQSCKSIGNYGAELIKDISQRKNGEPVNILTHCNAGWLAAIDYGTATAPIYCAHEEGIPIHVWVDETRPRNQGARLTAYEMVEEGVSHTVISDNTGGHLMQHGQVDMVITGSDRTTINGDVGNKIGTYLKALAANDNNIPFYVAIPSSTIDWDITDGLEQIEIEERDPDEVKYITGYANNQIIDVRITPENSPLLNYAFDVTPARLVTGIITERGICGASKVEITRLFSR